MCHFLKRCVYFSFHFLCSNNYNNLHNRENSLQLLLSFDFLLNCIIHLHMHNIQLGGQEAIVNKITSTNIYTEDS